MTIKIQGALFEMEEEVWKKLKAYLESIQRSVSASENGYEIFVDIETRIAEMLNERKGETQRNPTVEDIDHVMSSLGQPQDFSETGNPLLENNGNKNVPRKLVRDPNDKILGGVCSGIANYFNIDRTLIRVPFAIFSFFLVLWGVILYSILWIIIPEGGATKTKEELEQERNKRIRLALLSLLGIVLFIAFVHSIIQGSMSLYFGIALLFRIILAIAVFLSVGWIVIRYFVLWTIIPKNSRTKTKEQLDQIGKNCFS